jgi:hypothetical protein
MSTPPPLPTVKTKPAAARWAGVEVVPLRGKAAHVQMIALVAAAGVLDRQRDLPLPPGNEIRLVG